MVCLSQKIIRFSIRPNYLCSITCLRRQQKQLHEPSKRTNNRIFKQMFTRLDKDVTFCDRTVNGGENFLGILQVWSILNLEGTVRTH